MTLRPAKYKKNAAMLPTAGMTDGCKTFSNSAKVTLLRNSRSLEALIWLQMIYKQGLHKQYILVYLHNH